MSCSWGLSQDHAPLNPSSWSATTATTSSAHCSWFSFCWACFLVTWSLVVAESHLMLSVACLAPQLTLCPAAMLQTDHCRLAMHASIASRNVTGVLAWHQGAFQFALCQCRSHGCSGAFAFSGIRARDDDLDFRCQTWILAWMLIWTLGQVRSPPVHLAPKSKRFSLTVAQSTHHPNIYLPRRSICHKAFCGETTLAIQVQPRSENERSPTFHMPLVHRRCSQKLSASNSPHIAMLDGIRRVVEICVQ